MLHVMCRSDGGFSDQVKLGKQLRKIEEMEKKLENEKVTLKQGKLLWFINSEKWS